MGRESVAKLDHRPEAIAESRGWRRPGDDVRRAAGAYGGRVRPEDYQPPISPWGHTYRLLLMIAISVLAYAPPRGGALWHHLRWWLFADVALGLACYVAVLWRRRHPVAVTAFANLASAVSLTASGPALLALVSMATRRRWREIVPLAALAVAAAIVAELIFTVPGGRRASLIDLAFLVVMVGLIVAWGMYIGSRRELLASWQSRARLAEAEQHAKVREARSAERSRIAREMHDVLAHRISTVNMHAGALVYRDDLTPRQVHEAAVVIADTSRQALTELRGVLGVLREGPGDAEPELPQDAPNDLSALVAENVRTRMRIDYTCGAPLEDAPAWLTRTLYRCLQEGLTNARKHAPAAVVAVVIAGGAGSGVTMCVTNGLAPSRLVAPPESGFGLVGLAERVKLSGGWQSNGLTGDGRYFELRVWLPWEA